MRRFRTYVGVVAVTALLLVTAACGGQGGAPASDAPGGGGSPAPSGGTGGEVTLTIAQGVDTTSMNPLSWSAIPTLRVLAAMFDPLVMRDDNMEFQPALAESWEPVEDRVWEVRLREGVRFHNGQVLTAEDVAFSIEWMMDPDNQSLMANWVEAFEEVRVIDERTLHIVTKYPYPLVPYRLTMIMPVPKDVFLEVGPEGFANDPIGTGPFRLVRWVRDDRVEFAAFDDYWRGRAAIDRVIFQAIPELSTRVAELQTGAVDIITDVSPAQVAAIESSDTARVAAVPSVRHVHIFLNTLQAEPLQSQAVRQAMNYAVDLDAIVSNVLQGYATPLPVPMAPFGFGFDPDLKPYPYDPDRARELLREAGYPDGFRLTMGTPDGRYLMDKQVAQAVAAYLGEVGIEVDLTVYEWGRYSGGLRERNMPDIFLLGWSEMDPDLIWPFLVTSNGIYSYFRDPEVDALAEEASAILDPDERREALHRLMRLTHERAPMIFLHSQKDIYGVSNRIQWQPRSDEAILPYWIEVLD